jgi:hypothetical protein
VGSESFPITPLPSFLREMFDAGGLVPWIRAQQA